MHLKSLHLPKARVLVLEEDRDLRVNLCDLLTDAGYRLADGSENPESTVDLVLAGVGGRAACGRPAVLPPLDRSVPVIALVDRAAWTGFDFFDVANELGAVAVLQRPFSRATLLRLIGGVLSGADRSDEDREQAALRELLLQLEGPYIT